MFHELSFWPSSETKTKRMVFLVLHENMMMKGGLKISK
jgi:hypothetical protein